MRKCAFLLVASLTASACAPSAEPTPTAVPDQPLVIGTTTPAEPSAPPPKPDAPALPVVAEEPVGSSAPVTMPVTTLSIAARDPRLAKPPRTRALLVTELQTLEQLFTVTPKNSPDRPKIARRLADTYFELTRAAAGTPTVAAAHAAAINHYKLLTNDYPNAPLIDEVHYYLALEYELTGDLRQARSSYYNLIKTSPQSKFIPLAYFAFGELFFREAASDPSKYDLAEQAYKETIKYPAPGNVVFGEAKQRLSEIAAAKRQIPRP